MWSPLLPPSLSAVLGVSFLQFHECTSSVCPCGTELLPPARLWTLPRVPLCPESLPFIVE